MDRILLAEPLTAAAEARLAMSGELVRAVEPREDELCRLLPGCVALVGRTRTPVTRRLLEVGDLLRVVGIAGVGLDRVDTEAAAERGVRIVHTPAAATEAVAELAVALLLNLLRPVGRLMEEYRAGRFTEARAVPHGRELCDMTVGIVGLGRIGSRFAALCATGFGAQVLYNDIRDVGPLSFPARAVSKEELWGACDVVSLHVPLTGATQGLVSAAVLEQMLPGAYLLNTARGAVVDTLALVASLDSGRLGGAGLDVTEPEPLPAGHALLVHPRCLVTPHIAARTHRGWERMCAVVDEVVRVLAES
ncbi:MAG: hypothetical protein IPM18_00355 [Phycisphaerales bacterium]|nr:hypothetical protein [Phycisphaerales bacterium]